MLVVRVVVVFIIDVDIFDCMVVVVDLVVIEEGILLISFIFFIMAMLVLFSVVIFRIFKLL